MLVVIIIARKWSRYLIWKSLKLIIHFVNDGAFRRAMERGLFLFTPVLASYEPNNRRGATVFLDKQFLGGEKVAEIPSAAAKNFLRSLFLTRRNAWPQLSS